MDTHRAGSGRAWRGVWRVIVAGLLALGAACGPHIDPLPGDTGGGDASRADVAATDLGGGGDAPSGDDVQTGDDAMASACDAGVDACGASCGDGTCDPGETPSNCPADCMASGACGRESQFCCDGGACNAGFVCVREVCRAAAPACTIGEGMTCVPGAPGPDCCADGRMCGMFNATDHGCCRPAGQPCGRNEGCCGTNNYCVGGVCTLR